MYLANKNVLASLVENKFATSDFIQSRNMAGRKFTDEEVRYWVERIYNSNWNETLFNAEFDNTYGLNYSKSLSSIRANDYIGQTFKVDGEINTRGIYVASIWVFTAIEDIYAPLTLDLRQLINGVPSSTPIPLSSVTIYGEQSINRTPGTLIPWQLNIEARNQNSIREFKFDFPVYLPPGYYCFTLKTTSSRYRVYIAENGKTTLNTNNIVVNPYIGDFIYSSQGESWVIDPTKDLCFGIIKAKFTVGKQKLYLNFEKEDYTFDTLNFTSSTLEVPDVAFVSNSFTTITELDTNYESGLIIPPNSNVTLPTRATANVSGGLTITMELTNTDSDITPIVDLHKTGINMIKNYVDPYSISISDSELTAKDGQAYAKYITKPIALNDGFDADGITVYVDVNTPIGSSIEIFYRILNKYDTSVTFDNSQWYRLPKSSTNTSAQLSVDYVEEMYEQLDISYIGQNNETYTSFDKLAIKVVFYADNPTKVPTIKNLRVIATV